jgi:hypothetical protein
MGLFGFFQSKVEERILDEIFQEMMLSHGIIGHYKKFECHLGSGRVHNAIGMLVEKEKAVYFHFCDTVGYSGLHVKGEKLKWSEAPWMTSNVKQSAAQMYQFLISTKTNL